MIYTWKTKTGEVKEIDNFTEKEIEDALIYIDIVRKEKTKKIENNKLLILDLEDQRDQITRQIGHINLKIEEDLRREHVITVIKRKLLNLKDKKRWLVEKCCTKLETIQETKDGTPYKGNRATKDRILRILQ